jgi:tripartite ATP-independent transporter DctP family solute receptor
MTKKNLTRRTFMAGAAAGSASLLVRPLSVFAQGAKAEFRFTQYHNQTAESSLHKRLSEMWTAISKETGGRVEAQVFPLNNNVAGSDPAALKMLVAGEIQFFTLMGGVLGAVVPVAEIQQVPFAFKTAPHAHKVVDGALGAYIREEMAAKGIHGFPVGAFDNGMRQITPVTKPVVVPADLKGMRMRVPAGAMFEDMFRTLGCVPVTINSIDIYAALKDGKADAQENPLALVDLYKLYEVIKYVSMTNHMWSGFNQMAHLATWRRLPADVQQTIDRNVARAVRLQREDQEAANGRLRAELTKRGLIFNDVDQAPFRRQLSGFYKTWKEKMGTKAWSLLEQGAGSTLT